MFIVRPVHTKEYSDNDEDIVLKIVENVKE